MLLRDELASHGTQLQQEFLLLSTNKENPESFPIKAISNVPVASSIRPGEFKGMIQIENQTKSDRLTLDVTKLTK